MRLAPTGSSWPHRSPANRSQLRSVWSRETDPPAVPRPPPSHGPIGGADPAVLDGYGTERRPVAREVVRITDRMTRAATLAGPSATVRNTALSLAGRVRAVRRAVAMNLSELSTRPATTSDASGSPRASTGPIRRR